MLGEKQLGQSSIPWCDIGFATRQQLEVGSIPWHRNIGKANGFSGLSTWTWKAAVGVEAAAVQFNDSTTWQHSACLEHWKNKAPFAIHLWRMLGELEFNGSTRQQALGVNDKRTQPLGLGISDST